MSLRLDSTPLTEPPRLDVHAMAGARPAGAAAPDLADAFTASGEAAERQRDRLLSGEAWCVTTGQQPGLFTGPLYTVYKGLSVVALARRCEELLDRPVVPVFWVAGDDHDFAEAAHVHLLTTDNDVDRVDLRTRPDDAPLTPMYRERLGPEIAEVLRRITEDTPDTEFRPDVVAWLERHYRPEADLAGAFAGAIAELLGPYGLVVFRPTQPAARRAMAPLLVRALEQAERIERALAASAKQLAEDGRPVPVHVGDRATLVMLEAGAGRDRLVAADDGFVTRRSDEALTLDALRGIARDEPQRLSPNVLLRPVVEAALLPTLAYVGGPGELAYFPQCDPVYAQLDVAPQGRIARWSGRIMEGRVVKVLEKYDIRPDDLHQGEGQLEQALVRDDMPAEAADALRVLRETLHREYDRLRDAAVAVDPTLKKPVEGARGQALKGTGDIEKRIVSHLKQQNEILVQQLAKARHNLFPLGRPQERVFNIAPYLIRYGHDLLETVLAHAAEWVGGLEPASADT